MGSSDFTFRYDGNCCYTVMNQYGTVLLCVRAYGLTSLVVNKYLTTMMTKRVTEEDRFDLLYGSWVASLGPQTKRHVTSLYNKVFNQIIAHHERQIARMIME